MKISIYDTTLRDGSQAENISFSVEDKLRITKRLDEFGLDYLEGGWPGSNPKDMEYFARMKKERLNSARLTAFGSTRHVDNSPQTDPNLQALLESETPAVAIFGKSWRLHVEEALKVEPEENLQMIHSSVEYIKAAGREVIYDAEHFFDAYLDDPEYALDTLKTAEAAGADCLCLCETNGGRLPHEIYKIVSAVQRRLTAPLGIHAHNDSACGVANTLAAVRAGAVHLHGTINGLGERCGNADLTSILPNLTYKMGYQTIGEEKLRNLRRVSRYIYEVANIAPDHRKPYVGDSAFAHKGGIHVSAVRRNPETYEHISPELVGNSRRVLISELSGKSNVLQKADELGLEVESAEETREIVKRVKELENKGYQYEAADGSFEILIKKIRGDHRVYFSLEGFRIISEQSENVQKLCEATIKVRVGDQIEHTAADGVGPVNALDKALSKALNQFYPELQDVQLTDFKVRVLDERSGTAAKVRVLIEMTDHEEVWSTVGVSENIIEASWEALTDGIDYKLMKSRD